MTQDQLDALRYEFAELDEDINEAENRLGQALYRKKKIAALLAGVQPCDCEHAHDSTDGHTHEPDPTPEPDEPHHEHPPEPVPGETLLTADVPRIENNFDVSEWIGPSSIPPRNPPDVVGAFRMIGNVSHYSYNDPIVHPGHQGAAHLHEFYGNTQVDHTTTYESLRRNGSATTEGGEVNRSSYWGPTLLCGDTIMVPKHAIFYYKRLPLFEHLIDDTERAKWTKAMPVGATLGRLPRGLRVIARNGRWDVAGKGGSDNLADVIPLLEPEDSLKWTVTFPDMWDGKHSDVADHMSHMGHADFNGNTGLFETDGEHNVLVPRITFSRSYAILEGDDLSSLRISSDMEGDAPGASSHADYMEGWSDDHRDEWHDHAIDRFLNCSGGDMGSGRRLERPPSYTFEQQPARIPIASVPRDGEFRLIG